MPRPRVPLISHDGAIDAALRVIEQEGLESLTLERLATELGVRAPSLYYHFPRKTDILRAAAEALLVEIPVPQEPPADEWRQWFRDLTLRTYRHVLARPRAAKLLVEHFPDGLVFPAHEISSRILVRAGVRPDAIATVSRALEKLTFGLILSDADQVVHGETEHGALIAAAPWPSFQGALDANRWDSEDMFRESIDVFLAGIAANYMTVPR